MTGKGFAMIGSIAIVAFLTLGQASCEQPELVTSVTIDSLDNCADSYLNADAVTVEEGLEIGKAYEIKATGGAWTAWSDGRGWFYALQVTYRSLETNEFVTVRVGDGQIYDSQEEAEAANIGQSAVTAPLAEPKLLLWVGDSFCGDNSGTMEAEVWTAP